MRISDLDQVCIKFTWLNDVDAPHLLTKRAVVRIVWISNAYTGASNLFVIDEDFSVTVCQRSGELEVFAPSLVLQRAATRHRLPWVPLQGPVIMPWCTYTHKAQNQCN